mmetsp:Transcript_4775/g.10527  ORF Transcript_4775/g.10527 Transcript_4775/m.10527 type:complete len:818 (+) Transcript_4775:39-2492(+)
MARPTAWKMRHGSLIAVLLSWTAGAIADTEVVLHDGTLRVQALSPTLLRVEPRGPHGFEDRPTFAILNRSFPGIRIWKETEDDSGVELATDYYRIRLQAGVYWQVLNNAGTEIFNAIDDLSRANLQAGFYREPNMLHWPSPLSAQSYAIVDAPRFTVPEWGPAPAPGKLESEFRETNGFDFTNNVDGDTYVFLLGDSLGSWNAARQEFVHLFGPCPVLPTYAYGSWFTQWHNYTQQEAMAEVNRWRELKLPIDVWGLDMNWRNTSATRNNEMSVNIGSSDGSDRFYDRPNTVLFPNFTAWFEFLKEQGLKTYFNDHPYPVASRGAGGLQTSPEEVEFRWSGLTKWLEAGIDFWWFDRNWRISIPPPFTNTSQTGASWYALDNAAWGSYLYYSTAQVFGQRKKRAEPPIALTKFSPIDWRPGLLALGHQEHPAQHRFPVWWTGDGVPLQASVESMVDAGLHGFKPFVHSDCGRGLRVRGVVQKSAGRYMRWIAHCAFGTIVRIHGPDDQPWLYDDHVTNVVRKYLSARYKLLPSLVAAGQRATATGFPFVTRGDFYWPEHAESSSNQQYIFLDDLLVAPIWEVEQNLTTRSVWIPPGHWEDAWNGSIVAGPQALSVTQPFERQPMWHRRGGLTVLASEGGTRTAEQDWSSLTVEAFPDHRVVGSTRRAVFAHQPSTDAAGEQAAAEVQMEMDKDGSAVIRLLSSMMPAGIGRHWLVRLHLLQGQRTSMVSLDGHELWTASRGGSTQVQEILPAQHLSDADAYFPFGGVGSAAPPLSGPILEVTLGMRSPEHTLRVVLEDAEVRLPKARGVVPALDITV